MQLSSNPLDTGLTKINPSNVASLSSLNLSTNTAATNPELALQYQLGNAKPHPVASTTPTPAPTPSTTIKSAEIGQQPVATVPPPVTGGLADSQLGAAVDSHINTYITPSKTDTATDTTPKDNSNQKTLDYIQNLIGEQGQQFNRYNQYAQDYGIDEQTKNLADVRNKIVATKKSYQDQIKALYENGGVTKEQAAPQIQELSRIANNDMANLTIQESATSGNLEAATNLINAKLKAEFEPIDTQIKNYESLYNSQKGNLTTSEQNQAQATIQQEQQERTQLFDAKQTAYQTAVQYGAAPDVLKAIGDAQTSADVYKAVGQLTNNGGIGGSSNDVPQILTGSVAQASDGTKYVDASKFTPGQEKASTIQAKQAGIPVLNSDDVSKIRNIDVTKQNLAQMESTINGLLGDGAVGRIGSSIKNLFGSVTQSNPDVAAFNGYRTIAINTLQALGAGSGGARITASEIKTAVDNLPTITDSIQTAQKKLSIVNGYLDKWNSEILPNAKGSVNGQVIQTKVGAINPNF